MPSRAAAQGQSGDDRRRRGAPSARARRFTSPTALPACQTSRSPRGSKIPPAIGTSKPSSPASRRASEQHPEEGEGWEAIAPVYLSWRRYDDAAEAYGQAIRLLGPSAKRLSGQGQALVLANNGVVTEEPASALEQAHELDQSSHRAAHPARHRQGAGRAICGGDRGLAGDPRQRRWRGALARDGREADRAAEAHLAGKPVPEAKAPASPQAEVPDQSGPSAGRHRRGARHEPGRAPGDDRANGAAARRPARPGRQRSSRLAQTRAKPIACSTGRTTR